MSEYTDIRANKGTDALGSKFNLMNIPTDKQIELLNARYAGDITFGYPVNAFGKSEDKIAILDINPSVRILELPGLEEINFYLPYSSYRNSNVGTVKFSKNTKIIDYTVFNIFKNADSFWVWDTQEVDLELATRKIKNNVVGHGMIVIQSENGAKPKVIRV